MSEPITGIHLQVLVLINITLSDCSTFKTIFYTVSSLLWASLYKITHVQMLKDDEGGNLFFHVSMQNL